MKNSKIDLKGCYYFSTLLSNGATNPIDAKENTIRGHGQYGHKIQTNATIENLVHGSDSPENANYEIQLWFPELSY